MTIKSKVKTAPATKGNSKYFKDGYGNIHGPEVETPVGRAIYVNLDEPNTYQPDKPTYGLTLLIDKDEPGNNFKAIVDKITAVAKDVISEHPKAKHFDPQGFLKDGDEKLNADGEVRPEFEGKWYISLANAKKLPCVGRKREDIPFDFIQPGMKVRALAKVVASTPSGSCKLSLKPQLIQFVEDDGVRLGGRNLKAQLSELDELPDADSLDSPGAAVEEQGDDEHDSLDNV